MSEITYAAGQTSVQEYLPFEINPLEYRVAQATETVLQLAQCTIDFASVERVPRYHEHSRETDVEHSFMLAIIASELAATYYPHLDAGLISQFSIVHDLVELITEDVPTFNLTDEELADKEAAEARALEKLLDSLPPHTAAILQRYETQTEPEARFVRLVDKILPTAVDIIGPGAKVMREDYNVHTPEQLMHAEELLRDRFANMFPEEELATVHSIRTIIAAQFTDRFIATYQE